MKIDFSKAKRVWLISDTHFGVRSNSTEWVEILEDYFYNFFIPLVKKHYRPGDVLIHCGDVFDSRNAINLRVMNSALDVFDKLAEIFKDGIITIAGNHDVYTKIDNSINSLRVFKYIPNMHIYEEPVSINIGGRKFLLMPWRKDHEAEKACIESMGPGNDYLICHTEFMGFKLNNSSTNDKGCTVDTFNEFKRVYSGHIHFAQKVRNINMLGSPYQLTRSDMGNAKGVLLVDMATEEETYFENEHSPKFIKMRFSDVLEMTPAKLNRIFKNNFVDLNIDGEQALKVPVNAFLDLLKQDYRRIDFHPILDNREDVEFSEEDANFDMLEFVKTYISTLSFNEETKEKAYNFIVKLYQTTEQESYQQ